MVNLDNVTSCSFNDLSEEFKALLNSLRLDEVGNYVKGDSIILMIGVRSFEALRRRKDKVCVTKKTVRARMRLIGRLYILFSSMYDSQSELTVTNLANNAADIYRMGSIPILGTAINQMCVKDDDEELNYLSISGEKSGLKVSILNTIKHTAKLISATF